MLKKVLHFLAVASVLLAALAGPSSLHAQGDHSRLQGPCDIYAAAGDPCVAAHSTTRALYAGYNGPLYQVLRQSDGKLLDIGVAKASGSPVRYADAEAQDRFCADTYCWISVIYDQSPKHNNLTQAPRGGFSGPAMGGFNNLPLADMAPVYVAGHKVYGVFIEPGMGLRIDDPRGTAVDDQAEGQYWVINGHHFNSGCCFDYGNAEIDSRDDDNGTMETAFFGDTLPWYHGPPPGPWIMTDQENNLVGCVNADGSKLCPNLPSITWRFVTAMAKGEPHHWTSLGGDAQRGPLQVMFSGQRVDSSYDPMRKQGSILLGNGGDNSNGSQGTFYEGAVTAAGTFPTDQTDQAIQANVVQAGYAEQPLRMLPAGELHAKGVATFTPGSTKSFTVAFTNTSNAPVTDLHLSLALPGSDWHLALDGAHGMEKTFSEPVAPGATVNATVNVTAGRKPGNTDLLAKATWKCDASAGAHTDTLRQVLRNAVPVRINEFRIGSASSMTDSFLELYNAGSEEADLSNWTLAIRPTQQADAVPVTLPSGTRLKAKGFYLLGLANSGLAMPAEARTSQVYVRNISGLSAGDTVVIGDGPAAETRKITSVGSAASDRTTVWQPLPDGPVIPSPIGSTNIPVQSIEGFKVGEKVMFGHGAGFPAVARGQEQYEIATITAVGKPGTQAYLAADAAAGTRSLQVTSVENISVGDEIRLDIDSLEHGIETVTITRVGTQAHQTNLTGDVDAGATSIKVRRAEGLQAGNKITIGTPASKELVTIASVQAGERGFNAEIHFTPALKVKHGRDEWVVAPGTGLELAAPLRFAHAANLPFSDRGTGITFQPATRFVHASNEPVQALGSGITLDQPLAQAHPMDDAIRDASVTMAGYQGVPKPNQWFGGPELSTTYLQFGRKITIHQGSLVLRDASGAVVDSLNFGGLVDPWAAKGYQAESGAAHGGCFVTTPDPATSSGPNAPDSKRVDRSAGRYPDGSDSDSNCTDFHVQATTILPGGAAEGTVTLKVANVSGFRPGEKVMIGEGADLETASVASVGTAGATTVSTEASAGGTTLPVADPAGFASGQTISIDSGPVSETATIASVRRFGGVALILTAPLRSTHSQGAQVSGSGLTLSSGTTKAHAAGTIVTDDLPTPGAPNRYQASVEASPAQ